MHVGMEERNRKYGELNYDHSRHVALVYGNNRQSLGLIVYIEREASFHR